MSNYISGSAASSDSNLRALASKREGLPARQDVRTRQSLQVSRIDSSTQRSGTLKIQTDEGDTVTISFAAKTALSYSEGRSTVGNSSARQESSASTSSLEINLDVDGDLSKKEISDISKLLRRLASSTNDKPKGGGRVAERPFGTLGSLDSFRFAYQQSDRIAVGSVSYSA